MDNSLLGPMEAIQTGRERVGMLVLERVSGMEEKVRMLKIIKDGIIGDSRPSTRALSNWEINQ
jgi:hypothetical protein